MRSLVVGYGSIGQRHARLLDELGAAPAVVSRRAIDQRAAFSSLAEALAAHRPDLVVIAAGARLSRAPRAFSAAALPRGWRTAVRRSPASTSKTGPAARKRLWGGEPGRGLRCARGGPGRGHHRRDRGPTRPAQHSYHAKRSPAGQVMAVNLDGAFFVARAVGRRMAERGRGSIVQIASIYGLLGPDQRIYEGSEYRGRPINTPPVYTASKGGVIGLTKHLATYWGHRGVRVNTLTPGGVESGQNATFRERYAARVPLGRMASEKDIVGAMLFLAPDASSFVTGHNLVVDGGLAAW